MRVGISSLLHRALPSMQLCKKNPFARKRGGFCPQRIPPTLVRPIQYIIMAAEEGILPAETEKDDDEDDRQSIISETLLECAMDPGISFYMWMLVFKVPQELHMYEQPFAISMEDTLYEKKIGSSSEAQEIRSLICTGPTFDCDKFSRIVPRLAANAEGKLSTTINKASVDSLLHHFAVAQELATHVPGII